MVADKLNIIHLSREILFGGKADSKVGLIAIQLLVTHYPGHYSCMKVILCLPEQCPIG